MGRKVVRAICMCVLVVLAYQRAYPLAHLQKDSIGREEIDHHSRDCIRSDGYQRECAEGDNDNRHWLTDVIAGAGVGI